MRLRRFGLVFLLLVLAVPLAALDVPYLSGRVNDTAHMIPDDVRLRIEQKLAAFEEKTGRQVVVLTIPSLEGEVLEDYTLKVAETWKLGQKGKDTGALFLIAQQDRKMRIEVGYGLESELTDLKSHRILDDIVTPYFRNGDFGGGIEHGVDAILATFQGVEVAPTPVASRQPEMKPGSKVVVGLFFLVVMVPFVLIAVTSKGCQSWFLYLFLVPFFAAFPGTLFPSAALIIVIAWLVLFPILKLLASRLGWSTPAWMNSRGGWGGGGWGGGGWSGGGGGGGFSGGGGSFGGGGASGSW